MTIEKIINIYIITRSDKKGNPLKGHFRHEEEMTGTKEECEKDYRNYYNYDGPINIIEKI